MRFLELSNHPPVAQSATAPARTTHANYVCAGPGVVVGIPVCHCLGILSPCHSRAGGNRAVVVISYLIWGIILCCVFIIMKSAIRIQ